MNVSHAPILVECFYSMTLLLGALRNPFFRSGLNYYTLGKLITSCEFEPLPPSCSTELRQLVVGTDG
jgi:hypothetical protein